MKPAPPHHGSAAPPIEREFKLVATGQIEVAAVDAVLRELGAQPSEATTRHQVDAYLDDEHGSLQRSGIGLRRRSMGDGARLTCKSTAVVADGLFTRPEIDVDWPSPALPRTARDLPPALRDAVEPFTLARPLFTTQELVVRRDVRVLRHDGVDACELAIDDVEARAMGRAARFQEVELEVLGDVRPCERIAAELVRRLPLRPADRDKPTRAAGMLGLERPTQRDEGPEEPVGSAIARRLGMLLDELRRAEIGVRTAADPEHVHRMRVAARRMRGLVRAFRELWPKDVARELLEHLGETGRRLGAARDLDVLVAELPEAVATLPPRLRAAGGRVRDWITAQLPTTYAALRDWLRSEQRLETTARFEHSLALAAESTSEAPRTIAAAAGERLAKAVTRLRRQVRAISPDLPIEPAHRLRIAAKRVRYLAEQFADLPGCDVGRALRRVVRVQQRLGTLCDHEQATGRLLAWLEPAGANRDDTPWFAAALGALAERHHRAGEAARRASRKALRRLDRKATWNRLLRDSASEA